MIHDRRGYFSSYPSLPAYRTLASRQTPGFWNKPSPSFRRANSIRIMASFHNDNIQLNSSSSLRNNILVQRTHVVTGTAASGALNDNAHLNRLGKRPRLNRSFGFMSILGFSCSALLSWEGILSNSVTGLLNGGPAGVVWGFLINWIGTISVYAVLGELASIAPTAAGQC